MKKRSQGTFYFNCRIIFAWKSCFKKANVSEYFVFFSDRSVQRRRFEKIQNRPLASQIPCDRMNFSKKDLDKTESGRAGPQLKGRRNEESHLEGLSASKISDYLLGLYCWKTTQRNAEMMRCEPRVVRFGWGRFCWWAIWGLDRRRLRGWRGLLWETAGRCQYIAEVGVFRVGSSCDLTRTAPWD